MLTVLEAINLSTEYLRNKGIESPRLNAELLLAEILGLKRLELYLAFDRPIQENEKLSYRQSLQRRGKFEPLQYILGHEEFYGLEFIVNQNVLIPRPETELIIDHIKSYFSKQKIEKVLDIGTGSGNIAITLAKEIDKVQIEAIDISAQALSIAAENSRNHNTESRVRFLLGDIFSEEIVESLSKYDCIVSNPPYISLSDYLDLQIEVKQFEPEIALNDKSDGYKFYRRIIEISNRILNPNGTIFFEIGYSQSETIAEILNSHGFCDIKVFKDHSNIERVIQAVRCTH